MQEEDDVLANYIKTEGQGRWRTLPKRAGLLLCGKSCRLRWMNYLSPCVKRGQIAPDEEDLILRLHRLLGNRWSLIAVRIPRRCRCSPEQEIDQSRFRSTNSQTTRYRCSVPQFQIHRQQGSYETFLSQTFYTSKP